MSLRTRYFILFYFIFFFAAEGIPDRSFENFPGTDVSFVCFSMIILRFMFRSLDRNVRPEVKQ